MSEEMNIPENNAEETVKAHETAEGTVVSDNTTQETGAESHHHHHSDGEHHHHSDGEHHHHHHHHSESEHHHSSSGKNNSDSNKKKKKSLKAFFFGLKPELQQAIMFVFVLVLCVGVIGTFWFLEKKSISKANKASKDNATSVGVSLEELYLDGEVYTPKKNISSYLIIGIDKNGEFKSSKSYINDQQCDFLALIVFDSDAKTYRILHINRDTMTPVNMLGVKGEVITSRVMQLALSHTYGDGLERSCQNTADAVSNLLYGMKVDKYYAFTMSGVGAIAEYAGGIPVTIEEDISEADPSFTEGAYVVLNRDTALKFVRARMSVSDGSNISRMGRQKQFIKSLMEIFDAEEDAESFVIGAMRKLANYSLTNIESKDIETITESFDEYSFDGLISPEGEAVFDGEHIQFLVDDAKLKDLVLDTFYDKKQ